jgi:hypothetical protein
MSEDERDKAHERSLRMLQKEKVPNRTQSSLKYG